MEIIPCISLKNYKILNYSISLSNISQFIKDEEKLYILDLDGIEKDKPNLCTFQKISPNYQIWVDCGPRNIGDIVDIFMTGANSVTIRRTLCPSLNIFEIKDISENEVYQNIDFQNYKNYNNNNLFLKDYDGFVNFNGRQDIEQDVKFGEYLNTIHTKNKIYCYENNVSNISFWQKYGITGLLVDINRLKEFKNGI